VREAYTARVGRLRHVALGRGPVQVHGGHEVREQIEASVVIEGGEQRAHVIEEVVQLQVKMVPWCSCSSGTPSLVRGESMMASRNELRGANSMRFSACGVGGW